MTTIGAIVQEADGSGRRSCQLPTETAAKADRA